MDVVEVQFMPWTRQAWETDKEWDTFQHYLLQPPPRNLDLAVQRWYGSEKHRSTGVVIVAASDIKRSASGRSVFCPEDAVQLPWDDRARAYDLHVLKKELLNRQHQQNQVRRMEFETATKLMHKAQDMLDWPIYEEEVVYDEDEGVTIVRMPSKWAIRDIAGMARVASDLARLATDMSMGNYQFHLNIALSPAAVEAMNYLERFGVRVDELVREYENTIIDTARQYARGELQLDGPNGNTVAPDNGANQGGVE
jgi:hypothetical protein